MSFDPHKSARSNYGNKARSKKQEDTLAKNVGGRRQPNSGAIPTMKGDVSSSDFLFEAKTTGNKSLSVTLKWLTKISREAAEEAKTPGMELQFEWTPAGVPSNWILVPTEVFQKLLKQNQEDDE